MENLIEYRMNKQFNDQIKKKSETYDSQSRDLRTKIKDFSGYKVNRAFEYRTMKNSSSTGYGSAGGMDATQMNAINQALH